MQGGIILEVQFYSLPSVGALRNLLVRAICHMIDVAWTKIMVLDELVTHPSITMLLG